MFSLAMGNRCDLHVVKTTRTIQELLPNNALTASVLLHRPWCTDAGRGVDGIEMRGKEAGCFARPLADGFAVNHSTIWMWEKSTVWITS